VNYRALASDFQVSFSKEADRCFFSPGRVNLIGEQTDYCGGYVFPTAINFGTYGLVSKRNDRTVRLFSKNFSKQGMIEFTLDELDYNPNHGWANYPKGLLQFFQKTGHPLTAGFDLLVSGNIPIGVGLASSASLLMLTAKIINKLYDFKLSPLEIIKAGRAVENEYIGVYSGIMDHFAVAMGKTNHGILLDCHDLSHEYVPFELQNYKICIMNTNNKPNGLADSMYKERLDECEHALRHLQGALNILSLGDLNLAQFDNFKHLIPTNTLRKRARHVVSENQRTLAAVKELKRGNLVSFGKLMNRSHLSLRKDYEVTGVELDTLVEAAWQQNGVIGARMMGSGLSGRSIAIAIVDDSEMDQFIERVGKIYSTQIGHEATFNVATIGDGVKELNAGVLR
jgi:galactokinase